MKLKTKRPELSSGSNTTLNEEWIRLPKSKERFWGMSRTTLFNLCEEGKVLCKVLKKTRHCQRGIRLINTESLRKYLFSKDQE